MATHRIKIGEALLQYSSSVRLRVWGGLSQVKATVHRFPRIWNKPAVVAQKCPTMWDKQQTHLNFNITFKSSERFLGTVQLLLSTWEERYWFFYDTDISPKISKILIAALKEWKFVYDIVWPRRTKEVRKLHIKLVAERLSLQKRDMKQRVPIINKKGDFLHKNPFRLFQKQRLNKLWQSDKLQTRWLKSLSVNFALLFVTSVRHLSLTMSRVQLLQQSNWVKLWSTPNEFTSALLVV